MVRSWTIGWWLALALVCGGVEGINSREVNNRIGWHDRVLTQDNSPRYFRYYVPQNLPDKAPVVILLHGGTQSMRTMLESRAGGSQAWQTLAETEKFLLVVPNGVNPDTGDTQGDRQNWNDCRLTVAKTRTEATVDDVGFVRKIIDWAGTNYQIDTTRVYATGASNGGMMSYRLAIEIPDKIAGVVAFIANLPAESECKPATRPIPIAIVNGTQDPIMPWDGGNISGEGGKVLSTTATIEYWLRVNNSARRTVQMRRLPNRNPTDNSSIISRFYPASANGAEVLFLEVEGGGHGMPSIEYEVPRWLQRRLLGVQNRDLEGAKVAWLFLRRQQLR
jgi:polyhydroxybutyrate depolymerase